MGLYVFMAINLDCFTDSVLLFHWIITGCDSTTNKLHHYTIYYNYIIYYLLMCIYNPSLRLYTIFFFLIRCKIIYSMFRYVIYLHVLCGNNTDRKRHCYNNRHLIYHRSNLLYTLHVYNYTVVSFMSISLCLFVSSYSQGVEYWIKSDP